jgi:osmotically-inducible protein OsmY
MRSGPAPAATDVALTAQVRNALLAVPALRARTIHIQAIHGLVRLTGVLNSGELHDRATQVAGGVPGVIAVLSRIAIRS